MFFLLVAAGCGDGDRGSASLEPPATTSTTTTTTAVPTTAVPTTVATTVTVAPSTTRTTSAATPVRCNNVGFTPNSDNVAGDIMATGLSCSEAEALVRKVGAPLGPVNGAPTAEADGFRCVRTSQREGPGLPSATYECTNGAKRITFVRT